MGKNIHKHPVVLNSMRIMNSVDFIHKLHRIWVSVRLCVQLIFLLDKFAISDCRHNLLCSSQPHTHTHTHTIYMIPKKKMLNVCHLLPIDYLSRSLIRLIMAVTCLKC